MKKRGSVLIVLILVGIVGLFLTACNKNDAATNEGIQNTDIKELVQDYSSRNVQVESASITSDQLFVKEDNGKKLTYGLPKNEFFVSIAPYVNNTHE